MRRRMIVVALLVMVAAVVATLKPRNPSFHSVATHAVNDGVFRAVVLGDSVARGAGDESGRGIGGWLDERLRTAGIQSSSTTNLGVNGARTGVVRNVLRRESTRAALRRADAVIVSVGGNDLYGDSNARLLASLSPERQRRRTIAKVTKVVAEIRALNPAAHVYLIGLYNPYLGSSLQPFLDRQVNLWDAQLISQFASVHNLTVVRICDLIDRPDRVSRLDAFHPGAAGYDAIATRIAAAL